MKFSIITPSYNQSDWLRLCMGSVADQQGVEVEHIIQDAGTADLARALINPQNNAAKGRYNLILKVEKDRGMYDAINRGLRRATGDICAYLNCDEQYLPDTLAKVARFFAANREIEILFGDFILADVRGQPLSYRRVVLPTLGHLRVAPLSTASCAMFFRHTLVERGFFFDPEWKASGDAVWLENLLGANIRMRAMREPLAVFTLTGGNLGKGTIARREGIRRKATTARFVGLRRGVAVLWHRVRKAIAGAYWRREVEIQVFTLESPEKRQTRRERRVGFGWPSA